MPKAKEIHNRITAIESTQQITKALKVIATTKLGKVKRKLVALQPYITEFVEIFERIAFTTDTSPSPWLQPKKEYGTLIVFFTTNRGFCGGFNKNVCQRTKGLYQDYQAEGKQVELLPIGKKGVLFLEKEQLPYIRKHLHLDNAPSFLQTHALSKFFVDAFKENLYNRIILVHQTNQGIEQQVSVQRLFPLQPTLPSLLQSHSSAYIYEPSRQTILESMLPRLIALRLYYTSLRTLEAEHTARNKAMTQATDNADTLLQDLRIAHNRMRQTSITRQIIEITASAEALNKT